MPKERLIEKEEFICIDCETTGLDPENDRIIEVAIARFNLHEVLEQKEWLIDPRCPIPESSIQIHHITEEMVKGKPRIEEVLPEILSMAAALPIVGHGILFDVQLLAYAAKRSNRPCRLEKNPLIDTLRMARRYGGSSSFSLETLREHFAIEYEGPHRALNDVIVNIEVFRQLAKDYSSTKELLKILSKPVLMERFPFGKYKNRLLKEVPIAYLRWTKKLNLDEDLSYSVNQEIKRRAKGDNFLQAGNPFKDLL